MTDTDITERLDLSTIAYNAGLEIRYAIAASGLDPIHHIPEVDRIIERRLAEATAAAMERAAQIADVQSVLFEKQAAHTDDGLVHDALVMASDACELVACEIRQAGKDGGAG